MGPLGLVAEAFVGTLRVAQGYLDGRSEGRLVADGCVDDLLADHPEMHVPSGHAVGRTPTAGSALGLRIALAGAIGIGVEHAVASENSGTLGRVDAPPAIGQGSVRNEEIARGLRVERGLRGKGGLPSCGIIELDLPPEIPQRSDKMPDPQVHYGGHDQRRAGVPEGHSILHPRRFGQSGNLEQVHAVLGGCGADHGLMSRVGGIQEDAHAFQRQRTATERGFGPGLHRHKALLHAAQGLDVVGMHRGLAQFRDEPLDILTATDAGRDLRQPRADAGEHQGGFRRGMQAPFRPQFLQCPQRPRIPSCRVELLRQLQPERGRPCALRELFQELVRGREIVALSPAGKQVHRPVERRLLRVGHAVHSQHVPGEVIRHRREIRGGGRKGDQTARQQHEDDHRA